MSQDPSDIINRRNRMPPVVPFPSQQPWSDLKDFPLGPVDRLTRTKLPGGATFPPGVPAPAPSISFFDPWHVARFNGWQTALIDSIGNGTLFIPESNDYRNALFIRNVDTVLNLAIAFGSGSGASAPLILSPGEQVFFDVVVPQDDVWGFGVGGNLTASFMFSTIPIPATL